MKILYSIQATGNGHIARAIELMPYLQAYGKVDVLLSGSNSSLALPFDITYRSKGLSLFYGNYGGLHYAKMLQQFNPIALWKQAKHLPVKAYDLIINDFDCVTALACKLQRVPSIQIGHQASFQSSKTPRPKKQNMTGEFILRNYAAATHYVGLHFQPYDHFILPPVIKNAIIESKPKNHGHITVYLGHYSNAALLPHLFQLPNYEFHVFSKEVSTAQKLHNVLLQPVSNKAFTESLIHCSGVITGAGFETPAEAMYLHKKVLCLPIRGQYEQLCNAAALAQLGITIVPVINAQFHLTVNDWLLQPNTIQNSYFLPTHTIVSRAMQMAQTKTTLHPSQGNYIGSAYDDTWLLGY
jgi:uncharacterized protein (TIGR00661 family)